MSALTEDALRRRFPEISWDQPVEITIPGPDQATFPFRFLACRYCIAVHGLSAQDALHGRSTNVFKTRVEALDHIDQVHHDR